MSNRMTFAEGVSAENLQRDLSTQFLGGLVGRIDSAHIELTEKGRSKALISGEFIGLTFDKVKTPVLITGVLFNPPLLEKLRMFFEANDCPAYVSQKGEVSATAPTTATTTSDTVLSKTNLEKELDEIKATFSKLKGKEKTAAFLRMDEIETALKTM